MTAREISLSPHIRDVNSPLNELAIRALRRYGEFSAGTIDDQTMLMFIELANEIIDIVQAHPYSTDDSLVYYISQTEARPIPDAVMLAGLLFLYARQQMSAKIQIYEPAFYRALNSHLWLHLNGANASTKIRMRPVDGGTNPKTSTPTNVNTGMPE